MVVEVLLYVDDVVRRYPLADGRRGRLTGRRRTVDGLGQARDVVAEDAEGTGVDGGRGGDCPGEPADNGGRRRQAGEGSAREGVSLGERKRLPWGRGRNYRWLPGTCRDFERTFAGVAVRTRAIQIRAGSDSRCGFLRCRSHSALALSGYVRDLGWSPPPQPQVPSAGCRMRRGRPRPRCRVGRPAPEPGPGAGATEVLRRSVDEPGDAECPAPTCPVEPGLGKSLTGAPRSACPARARRCRRTGSGPPAGRERPWRQWRVCDAPCRAGCDGVRLKPDPPVAALVRAAMLRGRCGRGVWRGSLGLPSRARHRRSESPRHRHPCPRHLLPRQGLPTSADGTLTLSSELGSTVFMVTLPLGPAGLTDR